jgi:hypothetical protein
MDLVHAVSQIPQSVLVDILKMSSNLIVSCIITENLKSLFRGWILMSLCMLNWLVLACIRPDRTLINGLSQFKNCIYFAIKGLAQRPSISQPPPSRSILEIRTLVLLIRIWHSDQRGCWPISSQNLGKHLYIEVLRGIEKYRRASETAREVPSSKHIRRRSQTDCMLLYMSGMA